MNNKNRKYEVWYPIDYERRSKERAADAKNRAESLKGVVKEKASLAARNVIESSGCAYARNHVESVKQLAGVVMTAASLRESRDTLVIEAAEVRGAALDLQRSAKALAIILGVPMSQPIGELSTIKSSEELMLPQVSESLRHVLGIVLEASRALSLIKTAQEASQGRLKYLRDAIETSDGLLDDLLPLANGNKEVHSDVMRILDGIEKAKLIETNIRVIQEENEGASESASDKEE